MVNLIVAYRGMPDSLSWFLRYVNEPEFSKWASVLIVEQSDDGKWFNLGKVWNCGFAYLKPTEDVCFHPIDSILVNPADYLRKENEDAVFLVDSAYSDYWAKAFTFKSADVLRFNGFSNSNWGWGGEDGNLYLRCSRAGVAGQRRPVNFIVSNELSPSIRNSHISKQQRGQEAHNLDDGLSNLTYKLVFEKQHGSNVRHIVVEV